MANSHWYIPSLRALKDRLTSTQLIKDSETAKYVKQALTMYMTSVLGGNEELVKALVPDFAVGCRRLTPAVGYLECLQAENVRVVTDPIASIIKNGVKTSTGEIVEIDVLVCATGFDVGFCPRFPVVGRKGNLQDLWRANLPRAYMSTSIPDFPNYFSESPYPSLFP